ncbi:DNA gyrase subunit A, partial [Pseudomonadales bacterium]|nr:DNA gyrase subunit A [Pseudomonadales bacterium]
SANAQEAKDRLIATSWRSDNVQKMLERAGPDAARPDELDARYGLKENGDYFLSPEQAQSILEMRLNRLTGLEQQRLLSEYEEIVSTISELLIILAQPERLMEIIREELTEIREEYGDERRTEIIGTQEDLTTEDLITEQDMVVTLSNSGYAKTQPITDYQAQRRGGRGRSASAVKDEDFIEHLMVASTHDTILCFTNKGKVYWLRVFEIPVASRAARGRPLVNILPLGADERITTMLPVREYRDDQFIFMATANGTVKKTPLMEFARRRSSGLIAIELDEDNTLVGASITQGDSDVMLFTSGGKAIRFNESNVRAMGRTARGVRGVKLRQEQTLIALIIPQPDAELLIASENGYGKRSSLDDYSVIGRGGQGVICMKVSERNGPVVGVIQIYSGDEVILISDQGTLVRIRGEEVSTQGRNTQGVRLINLASDENLVGLARVEEADLADADLAEGTDEADSGAAGTNTPSSADSAGIEGQSSIDDSQAGINDDADS